MYTVMILMMMMMIRWGTNKNQLLGTVLASLPFSPFSSLYFSFSLSPCLSISFLYLPPIFPYIQLRSLGGAVSSDSGVRGGKRSLAHFQVEKCVCWYHTNLWR